MKIIFYSTNSNVFEPNSFSINVLPSNEKAFQDFKSKHPEHEFICISQLPAMFMPESSTILLDKALNAFDFADYLISLTPDIAVSLSFWVSPFDWLSINDCLVAEKLEQNGIKTITQPLETNLICFDKWKTHQKLIQENFFVPKTIFIDHDLYFCAGSHKEVLHNVYKDSIKNQITKLKLPLIIKDVCGLSSYGMTVVNSYGETLCYLNSKRNNSNRIIQEYIEGEQFGTEIYGIPGHYHILPLFKFTLNQYGITSPKQSSKSGPYCVDENLKNTLTRLADKLNFCGVAQIDLIFSQNKWYIIEVNPRLSGMTYLYSSLLKKSVFQMIYDFCLKYLCTNDTCKMNDNPSDAPSDDYEENIFDERFCENQKMLDVKLPLLAKEKLEELFQIKGITLLNQQYNALAKQEREKGYCECIICGKNDEEINKVLAQIPCQ